MRTGIPVLYLAERAWEHATGRRRWLVLYVGMFCAAQAFSFAQPYIIGRLLNAIQTQGAGMDILAEVYRFAAVYFAIELAFWAFHGPARVIERHVAFQVAAQFKAKLFHMGTQLPLGWHQGHHSGESIDRIDRAASALDQFAGNSYTVIYTLLRLLGAQLILMWFMPVAGLATMLTTALVFALIFRVDARLDRQYDALNARQNEIAKALHDYFTNMVTVITLRLESRVLGEMRRRIGAPLETFGRNVRLAEIKWFATNTLIATMIVGVLAAHARAQVAAGGVVMGGTLFTLFEYLRRIGDSFYSFAGLYGTLGRQAADVRGAEPIEEAFRTLGCRTREDALPAGWRTAGASGLAFSYTDGHRRAALSGVTVRLERGKSIAIVGESGSGKSTLLALLRGLQPAAAGSFSCDGRPVSPGALSASTTLMPQNPEIFSDTLRFNITFGMPATDEEILEAARIARFDSVLARMPRGLDTDIAEKGVNLSGGEKQRLALARGVFFSRGSEIVLLDEPTSSVDAPTEADIHANLQSVYRDCCMVSSIHKLHLLPSFDHVMVLDGGRLVEEGTFHALLARRGQLARMWRAYQAAGLADAPEAASPSPAALRKAA